MSMIFAEGIRNGRVQVNPARLVRLLDRMSPEESLIVARVFWR
jgi:hypothetical protein